MKTVGDRSCIIIMQWQLKRKTNHRVIIYDHYYLLHFSSCLSLVKCQVPKASSRKRLERVRAKLSVVTLLLPKLHSRPGLITRDSDDKADSESEANNIDGSAIESVAAAQKSRSSNTVQKYTEDGSFTVGNLLAPPSRTGRRIGVVSAPRTLSSNGENSDNLKNVLDSRGSGMINHNQETGEDRGQTKKLSYLNLPGGQEKRVSQEQRETSSSKPLLPSVDEEDHPSSVMI